MRQYIKANLAINPTVNNILEPNFIYLSDFWMFHISENGTCQIELVTF
jgi:hypothetical protein